MTMKRASLVALAALGAALIATPALAQGAASTTTAAPAAKSTMHAPKKAMHRRVAAHKRTCMDYAWQSQQQMDCQAGKLKPPSY